jgi:two-component system, sensor histidine kinase FlrB
MTDTLAPPLPELADLDLQMILEAWNSATERLQQTHELLRAEVKRLTDELEAKNRELARQTRLADLGQMASHVAHEVRNGLVPMKLYLDLLRRRVTGDASSLEIAGKIGSGFTALETVVNDLLQFTSHRDPQLCDLRVQDLFEELCESLFPQLQAQRIAVRIDAPQQLDCTADADMLRRALLNLVLNAIDVMPHGGELLMTARQRHEQVEISVADTGPGLSDDVAGRIFEPFFTTKGSGTGLGLAIVYRIAEVHGGGITAENRPDRGAVFRLTLPLGQAAGSCDKMQACVAGLPFARR